MIGKEEERPELTFLEPDLDPIVALILGPKAQPLGASQLREAEAEASEVLHRLSYSH